MKSSGEPSVQASESTQSSPLGAFWRAVIRFERGKINTWIAVRNSLAVAIPLGIGIDLDHPLAGVAIASGALNVSYSDGHDAYAQRARRMLAWSALGAFAAFIGSVTGSRGWLAVFAAAVWAFAAGLCISVSSRAGDLGLNTLVTCIIYGARSALSPRGALEASLLVLAGGLLQMAFALVLWPIRGHSPERTALGKVYADLSKELGSPSLNAQGWLPLAKPQPQSQDTLSALGRDGSLEGARLRLLFDQANRIRLSTFRLQRLYTARHAELQEKQAELQEELAHTLTAQMLDLCPEILSEVASCLSNNESSAGLDKLLAQLDALLEWLHEGLGAETVPTEISAALDSLGGQLRVVSDLAANTITSKPSKFEEIQASYSWRLQVGNWLGTLRANLDWRSAFFRHAVRLAACVTLGDALGRIFSWQRTYWIPMTIAVVLKPDFSSTFSRGLLRLAGTFGGLILATVLYHLFPISALTELVLVGLFTFLLRSVGPANYGLFSVSISGLIVFLIAVTGVSPKEVVAERAVSTGIGGLFALLAYVLWPTWERTNIREAMARLIEATQVYLAGIQRGFTKGGIRQESELDDQRDSWRRARSEAETSLERLAIEPRVRPEQLDLLTSMLASSRAVMLTLLSLEAGLLHFATATLPKELQRFMHDADLTLYFLARALRGSHAAFETLPQLRQDHTALLLVKGQFAPGDQFAIIETDRLTVALNTLREQVLSYLEMTARPALKPVAAIYPE